MSARSDSCVTIERLQGIYLVPRQHPALETVRRHLDSVAERQLARVCGQLLSQTLDADDPSVWLIRRMQTDLALSLDACDDDRALHLWAHQIATGIARVIVRGDDGQNVLRFESRAAYLAQFVSALAVGEAWSKWYYSPFDSLRSLPVGAAIREALVREPDQIDDVLVHLAARRRLERVLNALSEGDARRALDACLAAAPAGAGGKRWIEPLLAAWPRAMMNVPRATALATARNALRLYAVARLGSPDLSPDRDMRTTIEHLLSLSEIVRRVTDPEALTGLLATGDLATAVALARASGAVSHMENLAFIQQAARGDSDMISRVIRALDRKSGRRVGATSARALATPFWGIFLLLPVLIELGLEGLIEDAPYPALEDTEKAQVLRFLLALKCFGRARALEAAHDPALRVAVGLAETSSVEVLRRLSEEAPQAAGQTCLRLMVERLADRGRVEGRCLAVDLVALEPYAEGVLLLRDLARDVWLFAAYTSADAVDLQATLDRGLRLVEEASGARPECLLLSLDLGRELDVGTLPGRAAWVVQAGDGDALEGLPEHVRATISGHLTSVRSPARDLAYLALVDLVPSIVADPRFDLTWSLVAREVLRSFARRLLGFDRSSAEYLYHNFFAGTGIVQIEEGRIDVQLPQSPLHVVLRMAGMADQTYAVPWLEDTEITLRPTAG
jgi:hypothetical protein